ncbi:hypothetical protein BESB_005230 [Besnoitia besnoiti]|uniref:Uncharacterized protein n=1 Tax=Besnoitia besnoiti TaxID=94643 RepID=A0A2A9MQC6_BESBE|nr:hypothetical protein BESB_005230 [Besnoitia besnoiti]PFH38182.1 hypothetical protein BESB_005230 [Besnoitia besnoiti]
MCDPARDPPPRTPILVPRSRVSSSWVSALRQGEGDWASSAAGTHLERESDSEAASEALHAAEQASGSSQRARAEQRYTAAVIKQTEKVIADTQEVVAKAEAAAHAAEEEAAQAEQLASEIEGREAQAREKPGLVTPQFRGEHLRQGAAGK